MSARQTWNTYAAAWKTDIAEERQRLFAATLAPGCVYTDPLTVARGWDELRAAMEAFHQRVPGGHFVTDEFISHHDRSVARWRMLDAAGTTLGAGMSYAEYGSDGKLTALTGFYEVPTA